MQRVTRCRIGRNGGAGSLFKLRWAPYAWEWGNASIGRPGLGYLLPTCHRHSRERAECRMQIADCRLQMADVMARCREPMEACWGNL